MKKRWKLPCEIKFFHPYEAGDDRSHDSVIMDLEHILNKYRTFPSQKHKDKAQTIKDENLVAQRGIVIESEDEDELNSGERDANYKADDVLKPKQIRDFPLDVQMKSQIGCTNDAKLMKRKHVRQPFLSLYKIMPTEGEIEKFIRLQKKTGFPMLNQNVAAAGKKIDQEDIKKAEQHPGRLVSPTTLNALAGIVLN